MVFETVVAHYLNKYLFNYVENLDSNQLKIGVWGGDIVLKNLKIRENALDDLNLPVQLIYGHLGKFVLQIPWKYIYSQPVVAHIEDLFLLVSPKQSVPYDAEKEEKLELEAKQAVLKAIDEAFQRELEKDVNKADPTYVEKLVARVINNIQVKIANVHVRYEDDTRTSQTYACGITLNNFEIFTTDENWEKCFVDGVIRHVFKLASLDCLSVYMNCNAEKYSSMSEDEIKELFRNNIASKTRTSTKYSYVLGPISSVAKLLLNSDPSGDSPPFSIPKTDLTLEMEKLNVGVTSQQFQFIVRLLDDMNQFKLALPYRQYRPYNKTYKGNAKIWWNFAINSVLEEQIRKKNREWTWDYIKQHRELCKTYAEAHKERCAAKKPTATLEATCTIAEQKLDLFNLVLIRKRVQLEVDRRRQGEELKKDAKAKASWFGGWFGRGKNDKDEVSELDLRIQEAMTPEEKRKLHKAIGYEDNMVAQELPEYYEAIHMKFTLEALEVGLYNDTQFCKTYGRGSVDWNSLQTLMLIQLNMATCTFKQRPAASAINVCLGMKELSLTGIAQDGIAPTIIKSKITDQNNLLDIFFETNPLDKQCDQRIQVIARPLEIVYDAETVLNLTDAFVPQENVNLSELEGAATLKISDFKERSATGMQYMIESHAIIDLSVTFMPNILILPQGGKYKPGQQSLVVIGLGEFKISSVPHRFPSKDIVNMHQAGVEQDEIEQIIMEKAYDRYDVSIENIQILISKPDDDWQLCMENSLVTDIHLLRPTSLLIDAELCVVDDDPRLPKTKINVLLPSINLNLTEERVFEALEVAMSIPLPEKKKATEEQSAGLSKSSSRLSHVRSVQQLLTQGEHRKTTSSKASSITAEVVQYTSLEVHFALKKFSVVLVGSSSGCVDTPLSENSDDFYTPSQQSEESLFLDTGSSVLVMPSESQKILSFQILQLEGFMAQRTFETVAQAKLGAISLKSYDTRFKIEEEFTVIETPGFTKAGKSLLNVTFTAVDKLTPDFTTKYKSVEQLLQINFATLNIMLHQENILHVMRIANELQRKLEKSITASKPAVEVCQSKDRVATARVEDGFVNRLARIAEEAEITLDKKTSAPILQTQKAPRKRDQPVRNVVESIKLKIEADLEQVGFELTCRKRSIASLKISYLFAGVVLKSSYTEVQLGLKEILIHDMNPINIHSNILSIVGKDALKCTVVLYNLDETRNYNSDNMHINVDVGCMKIIFVNWFVNSVFSFMNNFQAAQQAIANAGAMAADAAKQNAVAAYENATRIKLNIKVKAPVIIVPIDSKSLEAVAIDLGQLTMSNVITDITNTDRDGKGPAIMDEIKLILKDVRLERVNILKESYQRQGQSLGLESLDAIDSKFGFKSTVNILDPTSFTLVVKRNLSFSWYKNLPEIDISGRLRFIDLNLFMDDYALIMSILNRNMQEGANEFPTIVAAPQQKPQVSKPKAMDSLTKIAGGRSSENLQQNFVQQEKISEQFKFNIQLDGINLNLMTDINEGLARFSLYIISLKGTKLVDATLTTNIVLCNMQLDDTRPSNKSEITKYLCRKDWNTSETDKNNQVLEKNKEKCVQDSQYMLDVTAVIKENDTVANVRISSFDLILCVDFLLKMVEFFKIPDNAEPIQFEKKQQPENSVQRVQQQQQQQQPQQTQNVAPGSILHRDSKVAKLIVNKMSLTFVIDEPDIILVETLKDMNTSSIIFNMQAKLVYRAIDDKKLVNGNINSLKMYMCSFMPEKRESTRHYILHPCVIYLHGSTPEEDGMNISLKTSEIIINISPATLELFNKAMQTIKTSDADKTSMIEAENYDDIWTPKSFKENNYWFLKAEPAVDALIAFESEELESASDSNKTERCVIEVPSIMLVLEAGIGYYTTPLISMDTCLNAVAKNWSNNLSVNGSLTLCMNYYNQSLAVWEPVIEQNQHIAKDGECISSPWELNFNLAIEKNPSELEENKMEQTMSIKIHSGESLEMTVSKTFLDLIGTLGEAFGQAMDPNGLIKPDVIAPYAVVNDTGFDIHMNFESGIFTLHEYHIPNTNRKAPTNGSIVFKSDLGNHVDPATIKCCTLSPGCKLYLQTKNLATIQNADEEEYNIYVTIGNVAKQLALPVSKSDKRYFSLYRDINQDAWGIVSEVNSEFGTTIVNIHSVVNIQNHFTTSIKVLRMKAKTQGMVVVGTVEPGALYHVPLHAIYSEGKYLHFAIEDYHASVQGIKWDECPTDMNYRRQIQCDPIETFEPFFINVSREKTEIYHEHSNKFKLLSAYYTLHLRPPVYLRNSLPINITVSVAGCSVRETVSNMAGQTEPLTSSSESEIDSKKHLYQSYSSFVKEDLLDYGEKDIEAGCVLHLPTVKLAGRSKDSKSYLVIRMIQYLERDWSCSTEISENYPDVTNWKFHSYDSDVKLSMDLCVKFDDRNGSLLITLYSPFWLINKTGEMLSYKTDSETVEVLYHPPEYSGPILFSLRDKYLFDKKSCSIRVDSGEWSKKIPLDVAGSTGSVSCKANGKTYQIGVHNHLTQNSLTKQITFIPFYTITNKCSYIIEIQEYTRPGDTWIKLLPNGCFPLWPKNDSDHLIVAKVEGQRTVPFNYSEPICILLQLNKNKYGGINVDVHTTEGGIYITFTEYIPGNAPCLLINHTRKPICYYEKGVDEKMFLQQRHQVLYTWRKPDGERITVFGENSLESDLRRDGIGHIVLEDNTKVYWVSFLNGLQRVLLFTPSEEIVTRSESSSVLQSITQSIEIKIHGIGISLINNETGVDVLYLGITSSGVIWEYKKENKKRFKQFSLHDTALVEAMYQEYLLNKAVNNANDKCYLLEGKHQVNFDSLKMIKNNESRNILRYFQPGVWFVLNSSPFQSQVHAKINRIQLDNQLTDCIFPVVLAPIPPPKTLAKSIHFKPIIEVSIVERVVPHSSVKQYKYAKMLMQEFHFKVDIVFLMAIAELFANTVDDEREAKLFKTDVDTIEQPLSDLVQIQSQQQQKNFYDNLHLGPMKVHVSFSMAGVETSVLPRILSNIVQGVGVTLTDVNDIVLRLAFFEREYYFFSQEQLISEITSHYIGQALKQFYVLVLGLDVLGNPYGLVVGIKKGVGDLFYEPFQGAIQGPGEFAEGLVLGVKSLVGHTVGGAAGAVSKITGVMGKGLAVLTFDEDYQKKRRQNLNTKPKTFQEGMARSGKGLVMGFVDGVSGCVTKPIAGAKEQGVEGFFKGLGKGTIGLVTRPTAGIVDFAHGTFDSVKRATELQTEIRRLRPPRFIHEDRILRAYSLDEANGNQLLKEIEKGKYAGTDNFVHCEEIVKKQEYVLVSNHRIIYVTRNDMFGSWNVQWTYLWPEIENVRIKDQGIEILLKKEGRKGLGLFSKSEQQHKLIMMPLKKRRVILLEAIESHRILL